MSHYAISATVFLLTVPKDREDAVNFTVFCFMASDCWSLLTFCIISLFPLVSFHQCVHATQPQTTRKNKDPRSNQFLLHSETEIWMWFLFFHPKYVTDAFSVPQKCSSLETRGCSVSNETGAKWWQIQTHQMDTCLVSFRKRKNKPPSMSPELGACQRLTYFY